MKRKLLLTISVILTIAMLCSAVSFGFASVPVKSVKLLNNSSFAISVGQTYDLKAMVSPAGATNKKVAWESGNSKVVSVDSSGKIKGLQTGSAVITVKSADGKASSKCTVTVKAKDDSKKQLVTLKMAFWGFPMENANAMKKSSIAKWVEKNLKIKIIPIDMAGDVNKYTLDMSSGNPADIYMIYYGGGASAALTLAKQADEEELITDMGPIVTKDVARYPVLNMLFDSKLYRFMNYSFLGDINKYSLMYCFEYYKTVWGTLSYNMKFLNSHNLKMPNTYQEFIQLLRDIKKADPNVIPYNFINGKGPSIPFEFTKTFFNTQGRSNIEQMLPYPTINDKWIMTSTNPKNKAIWKEVNGYYKEGLIDRETITKDTWVFLDPDFASGKTIVINANGAGRFDGGMLNWMLSSMKNYDKTAKLSDIQYNPKPLTGPDNGIQYTMDWPWNVNYIYMISDRCKDPERACDWFEFLMSDKGKELANFGIEGVHWKKGNGKIGRYELIPGTTKNKDGKTKSKFEEEMEIFSGKDKTADYAFVPFMLTSAQGKIYFWERDGGLEAGCKKPENTKYYYYAVSDELKKYLEPIAKNWLDQSFMELPIYTRYIFNDAEQLIFSKCYDIQTKYYASWLTGTRDVDKTWDDFIKEMETAGYKVLEKSYNSAIDKMKKVWDSIPE